MNIKPILIVYVTAADPSVLDYIKTSTEEVAKEYHVLKVMIVESDATKAKISFELLSVNQAEEFNLAKVVRHIKNHLKKSGYNEFIIE